MEKPKTVLEPVLVAHQSCHSVSQLIRFEFQWTIQHFELQHSASQTMKSTVFSHKEHPNFKWQLILNSEREHNHHMDFIGNKYYYISVSNQPNRLLEQNTRLKIVILNKKGEKYIGIDVIKEAGVIMPLYLKLISHPEFQSHSKDLLVNGHLTIYCEIETVVPKEHVSGTNNTSDPAVAFSRSKDQFMKQLEKLFESMKFSDVTLVVCGRQFEAHKSMLSARSPVFAAMFEHPTKEKMLSEVVVPNIEPEVFREVLRYIYTGRVPSNRMKEMALELFIAADKYLLEELKEECEQCLINGLSTENCVDLFSLADRHSAGTLKEKALDCVRFFPEEVLKTMPTAWKRSTAFKRFSLESRRTTYISVFISTMATLMSSFFP